MERIFCFKNFNTFVILLMIYIKVIHYFYNDFHLQCRAKCCIMHLFLFAQKLSGIFSDISCLVNNHAYKNTQASIQLHGLSANTVLS